MKHRNPLIRLLSLLLVSFTLFTLAAAAAGVGSADDPLVTLGYLNTTYLNSVLGKVDEKLASRNAALTDSLTAQISADKQELAANYGFTPPVGGDEGTPDTFVVVTMSKGQVLYGEIGCEVMLRVGSAACVTPSSPGLIDSTDASILNNGSALVKNHLYLMTIVERGVKATAATTKLLVRGGYTVI